MAQNIFKGLGIALITPFKADGSVDYQSLKRLVEFQIDNGADFLCILATTGEAPCLTQEEKDKITELVKDVNKGRVKILKYCVVTIPLLSWMKSRTQTGVALTASSVFVLITTSHLRKACISISRQLLRLVHCLSYSIMFLVVQVLT